MAVLEEVSPKAQAIADRFDRMADSLDPPILEKRRPMTQNPTPKRACQYQSRLHDANNMERGQRALRALAAVWRSGNVPAALVGIRSKSEVLWAVHKGLKGGGYYDVIPSDEYSRTDATSKALQQLIESHEPAEARASRQIREACDKIDRMIEDIRFTQIPGFFPTPREIVERMVKLAEIGPGMDVLEPSAGKGDILDVLEEWHPDATHYAVEVNPALQAILRAKHPGLVPYGDFLTFGGVLFDRVIMNPPFENGQDIDHVRHAHPLLRIGGILVAIMSAGPFYRDDRKAAGFRDWLESLGRSVTVSDLEPDAFAKGFRPTSVRCKLVVIRKYK